MYIAVWLVLLVILLFLIITFAIGSSLENSADLTLDLSELEETEQSKDDSLH